MRYWIATFIILSLIAAGLYVCLKIASDDDDRNGLW